MYSADIFGGVAQRCWLAWCTGFAGLVTGLRSYGVSIEREVPTPRRGPAQVRWHAFAPWHPQPDARVE